MRLKVNKRLASFNELYLLKPFANIVNIYKFEGHEIFPVLFIINYKEDI